MEHDSATGETFDGPGTTTGAGATDPVGIEGLLIEDELLVEEISIDGMCGVY